MSSVVLDFNSTIKYPEDMIKEGFTFTGWHLKPERMPAENIITKASWTIKETTEYVEIVFSKDLKEDEFRKIFEAPPRLVLRQLKHSLRKESKS